MNRPPFPEWCEAAPDATFSAPAECARRLSKFESRIRIRNAIEYAAGVMVCFLFGGSAIAAMDGGEVWLAASLVSIVIGTCFVLWNLHRRGSNLERRPEDPCVRHLDRQYRHQRDALRNVPQWYIAPLIPGVLMLYFVVAAKVASKVGWGPALLGIAEPAAITFGIFSLVAIVNWWGAKRLELQIEKLRELI